MVDANIYQKLKTLLLKTYIHVYLMLFPSLCYDNVYANTIIAYTCFGHKFTHGLRTAAYVQFFGSTL